MDLVQKSKYLLIYQVVFEESENGLLNEKKTLLI